MYIVALFLLALSRNSYFQNQIFLECIQTGRIQAGRS